jgi:hypothetical protein
MKIEYLHASKFGNGVTSFLPTPRARGLLLRPYVTLCRP